MKQHFRFIGFVGVLLASLPLRAQLVPQKLPVDWVQPGNESMHRPAPGVGSIYFLHSGEASASTITPYRCLPMSKPYELLQTVGSFVRRVTVPETNSWASSPAYTPDGASFAVSRWSDTCRSGKTPLELAVYRSVANGTVCLDNRCYELDTVLGWPAWNSAQFPFYDSKNGAWIFSGRKNSEQPLSLYAWPYAPSTKAEPKLLVDATESGPNLVYPTAVGDTLWYSIAHSPEKLELVGQHQGQRIAAPDWIPASSKVFNLQKWGPDSLAVNVHVDAKQGTNLLVYSKLRLRTRKTNYLPQYTAYFGEYRTAEGALLAAETLRKVYEFNGLFINKEGNSYRIETPIEQNYKELEYQAAALALTHPNAVLYENGYTDEATWVSFGFVARKATLTPEGKAALDAFAQSHPADSGRLELHLYFPQNLPWVDGMNLGLERAKVLERWADRNGWKSAAVSVRSADPALEWCPTQDTCEGLLVGHWGRLVYVPQKFKRTALYTARTASTAVQAKEAAVSVAWALPRYSLELNTYPTRDQAAQVAQKLLAQEPTMQLELVARSGLWSLELPVQGDEENARFFQKDWYQRGFKSVRWLDYGAPRTGERINLASTAAPLAQGVYWVGPDAGTSGANRIGSALQRAAPINGNVRIASWDPVAGICDVPGRCADGWLAGNYAVQLSANEPLVRSEPLQKEVAATAERYPLPPPSRLWFVVVDSATTAAEVGEKSIAVARQSRTTANPSIFTWKGKWAVGLFGLGDPAAGEAIAGIVQEDLPRAVFGRDDRRYESFQEWSNWTLDPAVASDLVAWRRQNPAANARLLVYGTTENTTANRTQFNAFVAQLNEQLQRERLEPFALVFERLDPHAESCADGCEHANKPYNRLVLLVTKPQ